MKTMPENMTDAEKMRRFRLQSRNMAKLIDWPNEESMDRGSGLCICEQCGMNYMDHPAKNGLHLTCDGRLWKL